MMRRAFTETVKDPAFLEDAKRERLEIALIAGDQMQSMVSDTLGLAPKLVS